MRIEIDDHAAMTKYLLLFSVFHGDPHQWLSYLESEGSDSQWEDDLPFVTWLLWQVERDEAFLEDLRLLLFRRQATDH